MHSVLQGSSSLDERLNETEQGELLQIVHRYLRDQCEHHFN